ncbi:hypothetical protein CEP54_012273 [Fusarium duplospermum]|uniref:C2H2-type domain-containing protein n=1 Tax=Fusarium duplospermum TaxID=1325734 RepID=A0A428P9P8_9HYPO|nr:hypothetical protein CEP54_012273 [Fusarium duplospermum]
MDEGSPCSSVNKAVDTEDKFDVRLDPRGIAAGQGVEPSSKDEPHHAHTALPPLDAASPTNAEDTHETLRWREEDNASTHDSTDSIIYTPADSDASSTTLNYEDRDTNTQGVAGGLERLDFEDTEGRDSSEDLSLFVETPGEDLLELPWFHRNVRRVLRDLLQQWQDIRRVTHNQPKTYSSGSAQQGIAPQQQQGPGGGKRRRERADSTDETEHGDPSAGPSKRVRRPRGPETSRPFSCPFCKKDLRRYQACVRFELTRVRHVKQHLHRKHEDEIDQPVRDRLRQRSAPGTEVEQWYEIFDLLFPGHTPRPASPYNNFTISEQPPQASPEGVPIDEALYVPGAFLTREFIDFLYRSMVEDPAFADVRPEDIRTALDRIMSRLHLGQISQQSMVNDTLQTRTRQSSEMNNADFAQLSNDNGPPVVQNLSTIYPRDDQEALNERPRSTTIPLDSIPHLDAQQNEVGEDTGWEELLQGSNLAIEGMDQDQQLNLDSQLGLSSTEGELPSGPEWDHLSDTNWCLDSLIDDGRPAIDYD